MNKNRIVQGLHLTKELANRPSNETSNIIYATTSNECEAYALFVKISFLNYGGENFTGAASLIIKLAIPPKKKKTWMAKHGVKSVVR